MEQTKEYNRNLVSGKRRNKKIQKFGKFKTLTERLGAESKALTDYQKKSWSGVKHVLHVMTLC